MKKVLVVTGTRADYGIYFNILKRIDQDPELELYLLVTGMHLVPEYGNTINFIINDGFKICARVEMQMQNLTHANMARSIGLGILGMTQAFENLQPDCVMVLGDRGEMLAASISAAYMNIPIFHLHGGEVSGSIDESVRHAISKLAHIHLVATDESKDRLIRMGEDPWRIHVVGAPRLEGITTSPLPDIEQVKDKYGLHFIDDYRLMIYHPVTTSASEIENELNSLFKALLEEKTNIVCVLPNSDAGSSEILSFYEQYLNHPKVFFVSSFEQRDYLSLLKNASVMVGNSSSGIIEAASFYVPVINIGTRQFRRERSANTIDVGTDYSEIKEALARIKEDDFTEMLHVVENVYAKENTSELVVNFLKRLDSFGEALTQKTIYY